MVEAAEADAAVEEAAEPDAAVEEAAEPEAMVEEYAEPEAACSPLHVPHEADLTPDLQRFRPSRSRSPRGRVERDVDAAEAGTPSTAGNRVSSRSRSRGSHRHPSR